MLLGVVLFVSLARLLAKLLPHARADAEGERARRRVRSFVDHHPDWRLRLYRTPAGLRIIATHARMPATAEPVRAFFQAIGVDPVYARMCLNQNCFRARLSAKPWRIGIPDHLKPRPGVWPIRPERMADRVAWVRRYEREAEAYAACRYEETLGTGTEDANLSNLVALHDTESKALDNIRSLA